MNRARHDEPSYAAPTNPIRLCCNKSKRVKCTAVPSVAACELFDRHIVIF